jgi:copper(I)-binding protein
VIAGVKARRATARRTGVAGLAAAALLTAGCTAGQRAQTADQQETLDGTTVRVGSYITLGALALSTPTDGTSWARGSSVPIKGILVNSGRNDDKLTSITSPSITSWGVYPSLFQATGANAAPSGAAAAPASTPDPVDVPALSRVTFSAESGSPAGTRVLVVIGIKAPLFPGSSIQLTFTFAKAGAVTTQVPVQLSSSPHSSVIPGASATGEEG